MGRERWRNSRSSCGAFLRGLKSDDGIAIEEIRLAIFRRGDDGDQLLILYGRGNNAICDLTLLCEIKSESSIARLFCLGIL